MDSLSPEQILILSKSHTLNKTQLLYILGRKDNMLLACGDALTYIDQHPAADYDLDQVWRDCPRADWWEWLINEIRRFVKRDDPHLSLLLRFNQMFDQFSEDYNRRSIDYHLTLDEREIGTKEYYEQCRAFRFNNRHLLAAACRPYLPDWETIIVPGLLSFSRSDRWHIKEE